jgi:outer membrane lipoprotein-sorting protein
MTRRILVALAAAAIGNAAPLDDILARMDTAAKAFKSYSADLKRLDYIKAADDKYETIGSMRLQRTKSGVAGIMDFTSGPDHYILHLTGSQFERFLPKANEVHVINLRKSANMVDQFLLLGFATSREELKRDYDIQLGGAEKLASVQTSHIVLRPKSTETLKVVKTIELWIPDGGGNPIQQKGTEATGNYQLATFSNVVLNPTLPPSAFELPPEAAKAKRIKEN